MKAEIVDNCLRFVPCSDEEKKLIVSWMEKKGASECAPVESTVLNRDLRTKNGDWRPGTSLQSCPCGVSYFGGRRSLSCAPCAYKPVVTKKKVSKKKRSWGKKK